MLQGFGHLLLAGSVITLQLAFSGLFFGLILGLLGALAALAPIAPIRWLANTWNTIMRGLPEMLLVLVLYYGTSGLLANITGQYIEVSAFTAGTAALAIAFGAYAAEVIRSALLEVHQGQREAALALGLSRTSSFYYIILPQAWRLALPGLGNLFLVLLKDTALVSVVGLDELMRQAQTAAGFTKLPFTFYIVAAGIYLCFTFLTMQTLSILEKRANHGIQRALR